MNLDSYRNIQCTNDHLVTDSRTNTTLYTHELFKKKRNNKIKRIIIMYILITCSLFRKT